MVETLSLIPKSLLERYAKPEQILFKRGGTYASISTRDFYDRIKHLSLGLRGLGIGPGDKVALLAENGPDWIIADYAILGLGAVTVPIYPTLTPDQIRYIVDDSEAGTVICGSPALLAKVDAVRPSLPRVRRVVLFGAEAPRGVLASAALAEAGRGTEASGPGLYERAAESVRPGDLASIIYTSGTTGVPKGVLLSHANFMSNIRALDAVQDFHSGDTILSFLPLSHVLERMTTFAFLYKGATIAYAESIETVAANLLEVRPTIMISVPRLFEKIYAKVMDGVLAGSAVKRGIFSWALKVGLKQVRRTAAGRPIPASLRLRRRLAHKLVFSKILAKTGGRVKFFISGGAPLGKEIAEFFHACGLVVFEGYGLTETAPVLACNTPAAFRFGTVGRPVPGVEIRIAPDGEILAKGPNVMRGYYRKPAETAEVFDAEGWFHTGDMGAFDADGFLTITDRKKDIIVTAGGKNVAPQPIENVLKRNPYIANVLVVGGRRKFISALVVPNFEKLAESAPALGLPPGPPASWAGRPEIRDFLLAEIDRATPHLAPYEKIKKIAVLDRDFDQERGELTPSLKIRRSIVEDAYKDLIDALYREPGAASMKEAS